MKKYQNLTSKIQVPIEWPVESAKGIIIPLVKNAITIHHQTDWRVVMTIGDVSAMITEHELGYRLKTTEEM